MKRIIKSSLSNISGIFVSEIRESFVDAGTVLIFIVAVILYPMLYSIGYINQTIKEIPVAVIDQDHSTLSRQYSRMLDATEQLWVSCKPGSLKEAEALFYQGAIHGVVLIPENFEKEILSRRQADVIVYCDAGKFFVYKQVYTGAAFATGTLNAGAEIKSLLAQGRSWDEALNRVEGLNAQFFELYNPSSGYCTFIVPGILIIVIQQSLLVGIGLLFGKNNECRKFIVDGESVPSVTHNLDAVLGKATAYVVLYLFTTLVTLVLLYHWLSFPEKGSFWPVYLMLIPFLYAVSFLGIAIGSWFKKRVHALMFIVFISPMVFFLTGVAWPFESLPPLMKMLAYVFPSTPMIPSFIKLRLVGGGIHSITHEWIVLIIQTATYFIIAILSYRFAMKTNKHAELAKTA
jgi:ABC-2 type transport system permease protein